MISFTTMILMAITAIILFSSSKFHLLMTLMYLEIITLSSLIILSININLYNSSFWAILLIIMVIGACEASLGLALLVSSTRSKSNEYVNLSSNLFFL